ncbi:MAG: hypothetical protein ACOH15_07320 [Acetobacterium sp.]
MKTIDRLLIFAKKLISDKFSFGCDGDFIEALGLDPEAYVVNYPDGGCGYDDIKALHDITESVWA